jgi:hypothetical protein
VFEDIKTAYDGVDGELATDVFSLSCRCCVVVSVVVWSMRCCVGVLERNGV